MTTTKDHAAPAGAHGADGATLRNTDPLARLPRVRIVKPRPSADSRLPAVGSFS